MLFHVQVYKVAGLLVIPVEGENLGAAMETALETAQMNEDGWEEFDCRYLAIPFAVDEEGHEIGN